MRKNPATPDDFPPAKGARARSPQIDTPAFKRWFDGSVVVTRDGKPRIMYHGTGWTNLSEFRSYRAMGHIAGFFAFDPEFSEEFALIYEPGSMDYEQEEDDQGVKKAASIYPVFLSVKKVFDVRKKADRDAIGFDELVRRDGLEEGPNGWSWFVLERVDMVRRMKKAEFDGFLDFEKGSKLEPTGIAVFDQRNIKSAYGNRGTFDPKDPDIRNPYTQPALRERLKKRIMAGDKGGLPGEWSARKAQLLAAEYEKAGGGYTGKRSASQRSLSKWTKQDWRTKSGKPSLDTGERYLPAAAIAALTSAEYAETSRAKRKATGQFSRQPKRIAEKTAEYRNPMIRTKLSRIIEPGDRVLDYDRAKGEDLYRLWDLIHTDMPLTEEALVEIEGMLDDDGVLVIQSGEEPVGLRDHFRRATRYDGMLLVQGPLNPEEARINTEKLRRDLE
jgi:hypothetical protein